MHSCVPTGFIHVTDSVGVPFIVEWCSIVCLQVNLSILFDGHVPCFQYGAFT